MSGTLDNAGGSVAKLALDGLPVDTSLLCGFLVGSLFAKPSSALAQKKARFLQQGSSLRLSTPCLGDPRSVIWLQGNEGSAVRLLKESLDSIATSEEARNACERTREDES